MKCLVCNTNEEVLDPQFGFIPCLECRKKQAELAKPGGQVEFTSSAIKEGRKAFRDDIEQPHRSGQLNKRWVDLYGKKKARERGFSEKEIKNAKYVYAKDDTYYGQ